MVGALVPQASPAAAQDYAHIEPYGGVRPVLLHAPAARKRSASAAAGACCAVTLRTAPCPLRGHCAGSASPVPGLAPQRTRRTRRTIHPCTSTSAFAHSFEKMLITSRRSARSVAPCSKAFHAEKPAPIIVCGKLPYAARIMGARDGVLPSTTGGFRRRPASMPRAPGESNRRSRTSLSCSLAHFAAEKNARTVIPSARRPSSRSAPRRSSGRCHRECRPATSRRGRGRTP